MIYLILSRKISRIFETTFLIIPVNSTTWLKHFKSSASSSAITTPPQHRVSEQPILQTSCFQRRILSEVSNSLWKKYATSEDIVAHSSSLYGRLIGHTLHSYDGLTHSLYALLFLANHFNNLERGRESITRFLTANCRIQLLFAQMWGILLHRLMSGKMCLS